MDILVNIDVDDLEAGSPLLQFCVWTEGRPPLRGLWSRDARASTPIYLLVKSSGTPVSDTTSQRRSYERHWTPVHLDFVVDEIEPAVDRAVLAGARLEQPIARHKWGKLALMAEPFGHGFCFVQFLGRGYDEIAE